jgi:hypothetical protein
MCTYIYISVSTLSKIPTTVTGIQRYRSQRQIKSNRYTRICYVLSLHLLPLLQQCYYWFIYNSFNFSPKTTPMCSVNRVLCIHMNKHFHAIEKSDFSNINNSKRNLHEFQFIANEAEYKTFNLCDMIYDVVSLNTHGIMFTTGKKSRSHCISNICNFY